MTEKQWIFVCEADQIGDDEIHRFDHNEQSYVVCNSDGEFYAVDGYCTHEQQHLVDGFVMDGVIECPLHMGQFDVETGEALAGPVCINLNTHEVKNDAGRIYLKI